MVNVPAPFAVRWRLAAGVALGESLSESRSRRGVALGGGSLSEGVNLGEGVTLGGGVAVGGGCRGRASH